LNRTIRTDSVLSVIDGTCEQMSPSGSPRSPSPTFRLPIHYRLSQTSQQKSAWDGYASREEFMSMHFR